MLRTRGELADASDDWEALEAYADFPTVTHGWVSACARHLYPDARLWMTVATRSGRLQAVAPLAVAGRWLARRLEMAGVTTLYEPMDLLAAGLEERSEVIASIRRSGLPLRLDRVPADSPTVALVRRIYRRGLVVVRPTVASPYLSLGPGWCDPASQLSARRRSDLRRARRRAEAVGRPETSILAPTVGEVDSLLDVAFAIEARSWKAAQGTALLLDRRRANFYRDFFRYAARRGQLRIALLSIGGEQAAMQVALEWRGAYWLLKTGYDEAWARCSPGILLMEDSIRYAAARGLKSYEFLGEAEPWIAAWTQTERDLVNIRAYPASVASTGVLAADAAQALRRQGSRALKAWKHRWQQALRAFFAGLRTRSRDARPRPTSSATVSSMPPPPASGFNGKESSPPSAIGTGTATRPATSSSTAAESSVPPAA